MSEKIFKEISPKHKSLYGHHSVKLNHSLHTNELFNDEMLAKLIEKAPREKYHVNTMDKSAHDPTSWREGNIGQNNGMDVIEAIKNGNIWVHLKQTHTYDTAYKALLDQIFEELEEAIPDFSSFKQTMSILISSPNIQVYYHCDIPGQSLWQVRGTKKVYVYPNTQPFLTQEAMEKIFLGQADEQDMPYEPWYDDYAEIVDLQPGEMMHWPINCPHRVVNHDCLNVSITTEHWTNDLRRHYGVNYANGFLRNTLGFKNLSRNKKGLTALAKLALAGGLKYSGAMNKKRLKYIIDFEVDKNGANGMKNIEPIEMIRA